MKRLIVACCLLLTPLLPAACTAGPAVLAPASGTADAPVQLTVRAPAGDGLVGLSVTGRLSGASQHRFFLRTGTRDDEIKASLRADGEYVWDAKGLAAGVYSLWVSAYGASGQFLGASPLTNLVLTPANAATLPPLRGVVRDAQ